MKIWYDISMVVSAASWFSILIFSSIFHNVTLDYQGIWKWNMEIYEFDPNKKITAVFLEGLQYAQPVGNVVKSWAEYNEWEYPSLYRCILFFPVNIGMDLHVTTASLDQMQF